MRKRRKALSSADRAAASDRICERLTAMHLPEQIAVYLASADEIDLTRFIEDAIARGVRLAAPRWNGKVYELAELNGCWPTGLVAGPHAILEPPQVAPRIEASSIGAWIVPGLAFAKDGARLGYGGGWYDRLVKGSTGRKVGVGYRFQVVDALPSEPHDIRLNEIVTD